MIHPNRFGAIHIAFVFACAISATAQQESLNKAFLNAVEDGDVAKIQALLAEGADVNAQEHINGHFALQYAINRPDVNLVKLLLDKGANVNAVDKIGYTALMDATRRGGPAGTAISKLLIGRGADIHAGHDASIFAAVKYAEPELVQLLLKKGAPVNAKDQERDDETVLMSAASGASLEALEMLLAAGAELNATNKYGQTALMKASSMDHRYAVESRLPIIELLLKKGANVNARDQYGMTPLLHAVAQYMSEAGGVISHPEVAQLLLASGADVQAKDAEGETALLRTVAVYEGPIEMVRLLLAKGIEGNAQNKNGVTALMIAADKGKLDVTRLLIEKGVNLDLKDLEGATALDHAISAGYADIAKLLLSKGAASRTAYKNEAEVTAAATNFALLRAAISSSLPEIETRIAQGADVNTRGSASKFIDPLPRALPWAVTFRAFGAEVRRLPDFRKRVRRQGV